MNFCPFTVIFAAVLVSGNAVKLPSYFNKCSISDPNIGQCILKSGNSAIPTLVHGDKRIHVVKMNPLHVNDMLIDGGMRLRFSNFDIFGLESLRITHISWDNNRRRAEAEVSIDQTALIGEYEVEGRILILPINGQGPCNITFVKPYFKYFFDFDLETKKNKEYIKITNSGLTYDTERTYFKLYNLFNGNSQLGETMLTFLDENWREVHSELGGRVGSALALVFSNILQNLFYRVPYYELFNE